MEEKEYFKSLKHKYITAIVQSDKIQFRYNGVVKEVFDDKLILSDRKIGDLAIAFINLTVVGVRNPSDEEHSNAN